MPSLTKYLNQYPELFLDLCFHEKKMLFEMSKQQIIDFGLGKLNQPPLTRREQRSLIYKIQKLKEKEYVRSNPIVDSTYINKNASEFNHDIVCGFHSGFPSCCIAFYLSKWLPALEDSNCSFYRDHWRRLRKVKGYVVCPDCIDRKNFVTVKDCQCFMDL